MRWLKSLRRSGLWMTVDRLLLPIVFVATVELVPIPPGTMTLMGFLIVIDYRIAQLKAIP